MSELKDWHPLSMEVLVDVAVQYGWIMVLAVLFGVWRTGGRVYWQHLPVLCWALVSTRHHLDYFEGTAMSHGPAIEAYWLVAYESMLGLAGVCVVQILVLSMVGKPATSLGTTGFPRLAMTTALLTVTVDLLFFLWAVTPHRGVQFF